MRGSGVEWTEKYRPKKLKEVVGNKKAIEELRGWAEGAHKDARKSKKAVILYGPPGSGKTSAAHALAFEKAWEPIELNASDQRSERVIKSIVGPASTSNTFSRTTRLIILDEADNLHDKEDKGGTKAITEIVKRTSQPIILIANDFYKMGRGLTQSCKKIRFQRIRTERIFRVLRRISEKEGMEIEDKALDILVKNANGDLRSAINDLQAISISLRSKEISEKDIATGGRDIEESIFSALNKIFRGYDPQEALYSLYNLDSTPEETIKWINENLPDAYDEEGYMQGLHYLGRADVFLGRARRKENFTFWRYAASLMACGVLSAKNRLQNEETDRWQRHHFYQTPWHQIRSPEEKKSAMIKEEIGKKIATYCKVPLSYARFFILPFIGIFFDDEKKAADIAALLRLDLNQIVFLVGDRDFGAGARAKAEVEAEGSEEKARRIYKNAMDKEKIKKMVRVGGVDVKVKTEESMIKGRRKEEEEEEMGEEGGGGKEKEEVKNQKTLSDFF